MADAANHFLQALTPAQRTQTTFDVQDPERFNWHFVPIARKGLPLKELSPAQQHLAMALLASGLSSRGFVKATTIMSLEQILKELEQGSGPTRDPQLYYVTIFGEPASGATWGWRVEGHHLSLNFTVVGGHAIASTPSFLGSNPAEVREGPRRGLRVLAAEEDLARELASSLTPEQRQAGIVGGPVPRDVLTGDNRKATPLEPSGLLAKEMTASQQAQLMVLIEEYVRRDRPELAEIDLAKIREAGIERIGFFWMGGLDLGQPHYYRVQGPTFLLEYDNTQNRANHIHAVWRDFDGDFGDDLLRRHYQASPHP